MYYSIEEMLEMVDEPKRSACKKLLKENKKLFQTVQGSTHNHQAWEGGYWDHIQHAMNIAVRLYPVYDEMFANPFRLQDVLLVIFLHDLEKPWAFELDANGELRRKKGFDTKADAQAFRIKKIKEYGINLTAEQENGIKYIEGEGNDYTNKRRVMNELAAFCHVCDLSSARIAYGNPAEKNDPWPGAERLKRPRNKRSEYIEMIAEIAERGVNRWTGIDNKKSKTKTSR